MRHPTWGLILVLVHAAAFAVEPGATAPAAARPQATAAASRPMPLPGGDRQAVERSIAGVVVGALATQFDGRAVEVRFTAIDEQPVDAGRSEISGEGEMRFSGEPAWIGFRFRTPYDRLLGQAGQPQLTIGVGGDARAIPNDTIAVRQLDERLVETLRRELGLPTVRLQLDRIETIEAGQHYLFIDATGLADFGREGSSDIRISAFYDRRLGQWLQLKHELATPPGDPALPMAGR